MFIAGVTESAFGITLQAVRCFNFKVPIKAFAKVASSRRAGAGCAIEEETCASAAFIEAFLARGPAHIEVSVNARARVTELGSIGVFGTSQAEMGIVLACATLVIASYRR